MPVHGQCGLQRDFARNRLKVEVRTAHEVGQRYLARILAVVSMVELNYRRHLMVRLLRLLRQGRSEG
jgi:hypothetical protein